MKSKHLSLFLALAASVGTMFADGTKIGDLYYNLNATDKTAEVTYKSYANYTYNKGWSITTANIPASVTYSGATYSVTSIGGGAFSGCRSLTSVTIPNSVTSIGGGAFSGCSSMTSVTIPNSVTSIGGSAFDNCSGLTSVTIPNSVTSIGGGAFWHCSSLTSIIWNAKNCSDFNYRDTPFYCVGYSGDIPEQIIPDQITSFIFGNDVEYIPGYLCYYMNNLTSVTIPNSVTSIGGSAFYECSSLTSIEIPNSVTSIGSSAFSGCRSLTSVTIPNSVISIGAGAFCYCNGLTSVIWNAKNCSDFTENYSPFHNKEEYGYGDIHDQITLFIFGNDVEYIPGYLCNGMNNLTSVTIPNSVTSIGAGAFYECSSLTSVSIGNGVTSIGGGGYSKYAFGGCKIASINFTGTMEEWCNKSWSPGDISSGYQLLLNGVLQENVVIPNSVTSIGNYAFSDCSSLTSVTIPNSVTSIGNYAFSDCCSLTSVTIPNSVTNIGGNAFNGCSRLKNILFGASVKVIEASAFSECSALEAITCYSMRPPTVNYGTLQTLPNNIIIYVPADYLNTYKMHDFWGMYDVRPIGATTTETTEVKVEPTATTADVAWPAVENAATYELVIKDKNGNVVCTLIFNANGQLTQIAFSAPARNNAAQAAGFAFTVTGLEEGTSYDLTITAKDSNGTKLDEKTKAFTTAGGTGVEDINAPDALDGSTKILRNGEVLILRGGKTYTIQGVEVK